MHSVCVFNNLRLLYVTSIPLYGISEFHRRCNISSVSLSLNLKPAYLIVLYTITCTPNYAKTPFNEKWWKCTRVELVVYCTLPNIHSTPFGFFNSTRPTVPNKVNIVSKKKWQKMPLTSKLAHANNFRRYIIVLNNWAEAHNWFMLNLYHVHKFPCHSANCVNYTNSCTPR